METSINYQSHPVSPETVGMGLAVVGGILLFVFVICILIYLYTAYSLFRIGKKAGTENNWLAWIPIANIILMLDIAKKPLWWIILFFIPVANIVVAVLTWMSIAKAVKKPEWVGILMIVPVANLITIGYLAFSKDSTATPTE